MRLGEIKQAIDLVATSDLQIALKSEALYGDQAYQISNYGEVIDVLEYISATKWGGIDSAAFDEFITKYPKVDTIQIPQAAFLQLNSFVDSANSKLPQYYSILETMVQPQESQVINIKLSSKIKNIDDLSKMNARLDSIFKYFNIDGEVKFVGFDKGSEWYVLLLSGVLSYPFLISCLKISQEVLKTRTEYFKSQEARISYEAAKEDKTKISDSDYKKYAKEWIKLFIVREVEKNINEIAGRNGHSDNELQIKLIKGTTELVKELDEGTEFHLSLNPPEYATEKMGCIKIDYSKLPQPAIEEAKQLTAPNKEGETVDAEK